MAIAEIGDAPMAPRPEVLEEAITAELDGLDAPAQEGGAYVLDDEGKVDWAMRKLDRARQQLASVNEQANRQLAVIRAATDIYTEPIIVWQETESERLAREAGHWEALLTTYHRGLIAEDPKAKSVKFPHGTLSSRKAADSWDFDAEKFIAWASKHADFLVRIPEPEVDKALTKKTLEVDADGTVTMPGVDVPVEGVTVMVGERKFDVTTEVSS